MVRGPLREGHAVREVSLSWDDVLKAIPDPFPGRCAYKLCILVYLHHCSSVISVSKKQVYLYEQTQSLQHTSYNHVLM